MKVIVVNNEIFLVKNFDFKIIRTKHLFLPSPQEKEYDKKFTEFCDAIRRQYKPRFEADIMVRDD